MVGIEYFFTQEAFNEEKSDTAELRRAKASLGDDYDPLNLEQNDPVREAQYVIAIRIQSQFQQRVLRRGIESKNWLGEKLIDLPELHIHMLLLTLQPFEREIHSQLAEKIREE